ncbi:hypothetical protein [Bacillus sp. WP8]|nr:hypothetical protein [Bacillus sp. WP8]
MGGVVGGVGEYLSVDGWVVGILRVMMGFLRAFMWMFVM